MSYNRDESIRDQLREIKVAEYEKGLLIADGISPYWADMKVELAELRIVEIKAYWAERQEEARQLYAGWGMNK